MCTKLYSTIFNAYGEEDDAINDALQKRVEALRNLPLTPEMLDISRKQYLLLGGEEEQEEQEEQGAGGRSSRSCSTRRAAGLQR